MSNQMEDEPMISVREAEMSIKEWLEFDFDYDQAGHLELEEYVHEGAEYLHYILISNQTSNTNKLIWTILVASRLDQILVEHFKPITILFIRVSPRRSRLKDRSLIDT